MQTFELAITQRCLCYCFFVYFYIHTKNFKTSLEISKVLSFQVNNGTRLEKFVVPG